MRLPSVRIDPAVRGRHVGVDKRRFERVMVNLMENAAQLRRWGPGDRGRSRGATNRSVVTVDDAGPGIDPAERTKVFERFYRGSASGRRGTGTGSGLGLALVAEHMRLMGGGVRVETSPQGGARLVLSLPVLNGRSSDEDGRRREAAHRSGGCWRHALCCALAGCAIPTQGAPQTIPPRRCRSRC